MIYNFLARKNIVIFSAILTAFMAFVVMVIVDPMIDGEDGLGVIALQLSFDKDTAQGIVSTWDISAFKSWIVMDYIYALSYVTFFSSLLLWLEKEKRLEASIFPYIAITAGIFDWIENSLELWFLEDMEGFSAMLFFIHSIFATLKWLALPIIIWAIVQHTKSKEHPNV